MDVDNRTAAALSRLSQISKELTARRELRDRSAEVAKAQAGESMRKIGPVAEKAAKHLGELGRRQRTAGGWVTERTLADKQHVLGFQPEDDAPADPYAGLAAQVPVAPPRTSPSATIGTLTEQGGPVATPPPPVERRTTPPPTRAPAPRARRPAVDDESTDDDFSTRSWMQGRGSS
jgi:hypothetical protein